MAHILVVDDEKSIRTTVSEFLKDAGYLVNVANDADEALEFLTTEKIDVVVSDIILPRITGIDLLKSIREVSPDVQVILMTGEPNISTASEAVRAGAFDYLTKPITKEQIIKTVDYAVKVKVVDDERRRLEKDNIEYQKNLEKLVEERTKSLLESEQNFKTLAEQSPSFTVSLDLEGKITFVSRVPLEYKNFNLIGQDFLNLAHKEEAKKIEEARLKVIESKTLVSLEVKAPELLPNIWYNLSIGPLFRDGKIAGVIFILLDITEKKDSEQLMLTFHDLSRKMSLAKTLNETLQICLDLTLKITKMDVGGIYLVNPIMQDLNLIVETGLSKSFIEQSSYYPADSLNAKVVLKGDPIYTNYQDLNSIPKDREGIEKLEAIAIVPVLHKDEVIACFNIASHVLKEVPEKVGVLIETISAQVSEIIFRARIENKIRESEERYRELAENSPYAIVIHSDSNVLYINRRAVLLMKGNSTKDFIGKNPIDFIHPEDHDKVIENIQLAFLKKKNSSSSFPEVLQTSYERYICQDNSIINVESTGQVIDYMGKPAIQIVFKDITEQKVAELALKESEEKYKTLVENSSDLIFLIDTDFKIISVNSAAQKNLRKPYEDIIGHSISDFYTKEIAEEYINNLNEVFRTGKKFTSQSSILIGKDLVWLNTSLNPVKDNDGKIFAVLGASRDITKEKKSEILLQKSQEYYQKLFEESPLPIWIEDFTEIVSYIKELKKKGVEDFVKYLDKNPDEISVFSEKNKILDLNNAAVKFHCADSKDYLIKNIEKVFTNKTRDVFKREIAAIANGEEYLSSESELVTLKGEVKTVILSMHIHEDSEKQSIVYLSTADITERKETEKALEESEERYKKFFMSDMTGDYLTTPKGKLLSCNPAFLEIFGFKSEKEALSTNMGSIYRKKADRVEFLDKINSKKEIKNNILKMQKVTGEPIIVQENVLGEFDERGKLKKIRGYLYNITDRVKAEKELKESEKRYRILAENSTDTIWLMQLDGTFLYHSPAVMQLRGYTPEEANKVSMEQTMTPQSITFIEKIFAQENEKPMKEQWNNLRFELEMFRKDGSKIWTEVSANALYDEGYQIIGIQGATHEITERKQAEKALLKSEASLKEAQKIAKIGSWEWDIISDEMKWSEEMKNIYGLDKNEIISPDLQMQFTHVNDKQIIEKAFNSVFSNLPLDSIEYRIVLRDGTIKQIIGLAEREVDTAGNTIRVFGTIQDISDRKEMERVLIESEARFRTIVTNTEEILFMIDKDGIFTLSEGKGLTALGLEPGQIVGLSSYDVYKDFPKILSGIETALKGEATNDIINVGDSFFDIWYSPHENKNGDIIGLIGMAVNITEQYLAEEALQKSEERFSRLSGLTYEGILIHEMGKAVDLNLAFSKMFGYEIDELIGKNVIQLLVPEKYWALIGEKISIEEVVPYEVEGIRKDGSTFHLEIQSRNISDITKRNLRVTAVRDITLRKQNELEIQKLLNAVEQSHSSIVITDTDGNIEYVNKYFTEVTGYTKEEALGENPRVLKTDHQDAKVYEDLWQTLTRGDVWNGEFLNKKKSGELYWESAVISPIKDKNGKTINYVAIKEDITEWKKTEEDRALLENVIESAVNEVFIVDLEKKRVVYANKSATSNLQFSLTELQNMVFFEFVPQFDSKDTEKIIGSLISGERENIVIESLHKRKDGSTYPVQIFLKLVPHGKKMNLVVIAIDITKRKIDEEELTQHRLHLEDKIEERTEEISVINEMLKKEILKKDKAEKRVFESLVKEKEINQLKDRFMSTVSHDLRTPLTAILSSVELMERFYGKWNKEQVIHKYGQIKTSVSRITDMLSHVLELSRIERGKITTNFAIVNLKMEFQNIIDEIDLIKEEKHQLIYTYKLEKENYDVDIHLLREILTNLLTNGVKYSPKGGIVELLVEREDKWLILQVSDEGMGISADEIDNIFNDFYRTNGSQNIPGSGLGLSIVKHYVDMYKGEIEVESKLGEGSTFKVKIPQDDK